MNVTRRTWNMISKSFIKQAKNDNNDNNYNNNRNNNTLKQQVPPFHHQYQAPCKLFNIKKKKNNLNNKIS